MQAYSDPSRESDPHALPMWRCSTSRQRSRQSLVSTRMNIGSCGDSSPDGLQQPRARKGHRPHGEGMRPHGWLFWQACFPGCLPDSEPIGPFDTQAEALADAQAGAEEEL